MTSKSKYPFWTHITPRVMMSPNKVEHTVKVTYLGKGIYGCRVFLNGALNAENRCYGKENISVACRDLLRWESKLGNISDYASKARTRPGRKDYERKLHHQKK